MKRSPIERHLRALAAKWGGPTPRRYLPSPQTPDRMDPPPRKRSMYEDLRDRGAGYCHHCGAVVTPGDLKNHPIQPAPALPSTQTGEDA